MTEVLDPFDVIALDLPLRNKYSETLPPSQNTAQYVDDLYNDAADAFREMIATLKRDLSDAFSAAQVKRLERLLAVYRAAWQGLEEREGEATLQEAKEGQAPWWGAHFLAPLQEAAALEQRQARNAPGRYGLADLAE